MKTATFAVRRSALVRAAYRVRYGSTLHTKILLLTVGQQVLLTAREASDLRVVIRGLVAAVLYTMS